MSDSVPSPPLADPGSHSLADESRSPPPSHRRWAILYRLPLIADPNMLPSGVDFHAILDTPPHASFIVVTRGLLPDAANPVSIAVLKSIDATGRFLLVSASQGASTERLIVCQAVSSKAFTLPAVPASLNIQLSMRDCIGVIDDPRGGSGGDYSFVVAQLHAASAPFATAPESTSATAPASTPSATAPASETTPAPLVDRLPLICFHSYEKSWSVKFLIISPCEYDILKKFHVDTVVSHCGMLVFVDLTCGMLICNPLLEEQDARFVLFPIPDDFAEEEHVSDARDMPIGLHRSVTASEGRLRFLMIYSVRHAAMLRMCSLRDDNANDWDLDYVIPFDEIFHDQSYQEAGFTPKLPSIGLVDPEHHGIVYLISGSTIFAVELATRRTVDYATFFTNVGLEYITHSSMEICSWLLPPSPTRTQCSTSKSTARSTWAALKRSGRALKKYTKITARFLQDKKNCIEILPDTVQGAAVILSAICPSSVSAAYVWPAARLITQVATKAVKAINFSESVSRFFKPTSDPDRFKHVIVETKEEAEEKIKIWYDKGRPEGVYFGFPYHMNEADKAILREVFERQCLENILWEIEECIHGYDLLESDS